MNILVLGASGFCGKTIFERLREDYQAYGTYCRQRDPYQRDPDMFHLDAADLKCFQDILNQTGPQVIVSSMRGDYGQQLTLHGMAADYIAGKGNGKLIFLSTANVFDNSVSTVHYEEDATTSDNDYGNYKIACENLLRDRLKERAVMIRVPAIWGRNCPRIQRLKADIDQKKAVHTYVNLYINDTLDTQVADYIQYIIENDLQGIFHVGSTDIMEHHSFLVKLIERLHFPMPEFDKEILDPRMYQAVLSSRKDIPERLLLTEENILEYLSDRSESG